MSAHGYWADHRTYTWSSMLDALATARPTTWGDYTASDNVDGSHSAPSWAGTLTYEDACALVSGRRTWQEGQASIEEQAREQAGKHVLKRPFFDYGYDVTGAFFDVASVLEGRPECWLNPEPSMQGDPGVIRLVVDCFTSAGVSAEIMQARMCAVSAAALTLEAMGNPIEVIAVYPSHKDAEGFCIEVKVNNAGEPIDTQRLVAMAHPAWFRRINFRLLELTPIESVAQYHAHTYGQSQGVPAEHVTLNWGARAVYIPPCHYNAQMNPTVEKLLTLVKQGNVKGTDDYVDA